CFLLGENVTSSFSPVIHAMFGNNNYFLNSVSADSLEIFLKSKQFRGANVTIPYKSTVIKHLDFLSAECALIGSVNTIKNCSGVLFGYNTDLFGMEYMLNRAKIDLKDKEVLILGSGATSKTAQFTTQKLKAKSIFFASRNGDINYDNIYEKCNPQVIINTTPVGMIGKCDDILVDIIRFKNLESVADVIYNPLNTRLLQSAKREGLKYTNGLSMLVAQASAANEIFFDEKSNSQKIEEAIRAVKSKMLNVALIGMPGSGKSVVGEKLAEMLSKTFIDIDKNLENSEKSAICDIFKKYGESKFRLLESEEIKNISKKTDAVISTGGGCVLNTENIVNLKKNAVIVWIKRDI
ncbi:MAG: shikimate kinase, partial [Clostridia bacterium]